jgi:hypothetical protein
LRQTIDPSFNFQTVAMAIHEYANLSPVAPTGTTSSVDDAQSFVDVSGIVDAASDGGGQDANLIQLTVETTQSNDLLFLACSTLGYCAPLTSVPSLDAPLAAIDILQVMAGPFRWRSKVSIRDLYNGVKGTYISPSNKWQASDFPPYAQDTDHGYASGSPLDPFGDANLAADAGDRRWLDIQLPFTISCAMAQRLAKIELMRRRQQGTGTFMYNMSLYQVTALDIIAMTLPLLGRTNKLLEVTAHRLKLDKTKSEKGNNETTLLGTEIDVQETDPSVYAWSATEELTPQGYQQATMPTNVGPTGTGALADLYTVNGT